MSGIWKREWLTFVMIVVAIGLLALSARQGREELTTTIVLIVAVAAGEALRRVFDRNDEDRRA